MPAKKTGTKLQPNMPATTPAGKQTGTSPAVPETPLGHVDAPGELVFRPQEAATVVHPTPGLPDFGEQPEPNYASVQIANEDLSTKTKRVEGYVRAGELFLVRTSDDGSQEQGSVSVSWKKLKAGDQPDPALTSITNR